MREENRRKIFKAKLRCAFAMCVLKIFILTVKYYPERIGELVDATDTLLKTFREECNKGDEKNVDI